MLSVSPGQINKIITIFKIVEIMGEKLPALMSAEMFFLCGKKLKKKIKIIFQRSIMHQIKVL